MRLPHPIPHLDDRLPGVTNGRERICPSRLPSVFMGWIGSALLVMAWSLAVRSIFLAHFFVQPTPEYNPRTIDHLTTRAVVRESLAGHWPASTNITTTTAASLLPGNESTWAHELVSRVAVTTETPLQDYSSVDYVACCGLGHRLVRMSNAYAVAHDPRIAMALRTHWGWCGDHESGVVEVFSSIFRPETAQELSYVQSTHSRIRYLNEVDGYTRGLQRTGVGRDNCTCTSDKIQSDLEFYQSLLRRFRFQDHVQEFVMRNFGRSANISTDDRLVIGLHIRAGNGEQGDFVQKKRNLADPDLWVRNVANRLNEWCRNLTANQASRPSPVLFIATDTPSLIEAFRKEAKGYFSVVDYQQDRGEEGSGVFFGQTGHIVNRFTNKQACLQRWYDALLDMILLSHADVLIAGRPSSFVQTMPMSLAFGRRARDRKTGNQVFCEVMGDSGDELVCFDSFMQWCCDYPTWHSGRDFVSFLSSPYQASGPPIKRILPRPLDHRQCQPRPGVRAKLWCLPHAWEIS